MNIEVRCPQCGEPAGAKGGCVHLRWRPGQGGPDVLARHVVVVSPYTKGRGFSAKSIPAAFWEAEQDWVLDRIFARLQVIEGYCFGDPADIDGLCRDIWHRVAPQPERGVPRPRNGFVLEDVR